MSDDQLTDQVNAVNQLAAAVRRLRDLGVFRSRRFTGDLGEWYVATLYGAVQPTSQTQKGWDLKLPSTGERLQVKTVSFDKSSLWSYVGADPALFDRYVFLVITDSFTIKWLFDIPATRLPTIWRVGKEGKPYFQFNDALEFRVNLGKLPGYQKLARLVEGAS